jgi:hypothetical protein
LPSSSRRSKVRADAAAVQIIEHGDFIRVCLGGIGLKISPAALAEVLLDQVHGDVIRQVGYGRIMLRISLPPSRNLTVAAKPGKPVNLPHASSQSRFDWTARYPAIGRTALALLPKRSRWTARRSCADGKCLPIDLIRALPQRMLRAA